jgi:hypothetical protein
VIDGDAPEAKAEIADLQRQQRQIDQQLHAAQRTTANIMDAATAVQSMMERLMNRGRSIESLSVYQLRQVLAALVQSATANMLTREVEISLRVPQKVFSDAKTAIETLCLQQTSPSSTVDEAQQDQSYPSGQHRVRN